MEGCLRRTSLLVIINGRPHEMLGSFRALRLADPISPILFSILVNLLGRMVDKVASCLEIRGLVVGKDKIETNHLQFQDDFLSLFYFLSRKICHFGSICGLFFCFLGLKINMFKSVLPLD